MMMISNLLIHQKYNPPVCRRMYHLHESIYTTKNEVDGGGGGGGGGGKLIS